MSKKKLFHRGGWLALIGGIVIGTLFFLRGGALLKRVLNFIEKKYFAFIGDQGPLQPLRLGHWQRVGRGIWQKRSVYKRKFFWVRIEVQLVKLSRGKFRFTLYRGEPSYADEVLKKTGAVGAINAGPFYKNLSPWGILIQEGKFVSSRLIARERDGLCAIIEGELSIYPATVRSLRSLKRFASKGEARGFFAFQSTPLLVADNFSPPLPRKPWLVDRRSALCIDRDGDIILLTTVGRFNGLSYYELRGIMSAPISRGGLNCRWGLNLDGGAPAQMAVKLGRFSLVIPGQAPTPNFLLFFKR